MSRERETERQEGVDVAERPSARTPRRHHVVLHNDDYTTMEFVVDVLVTVFGKTETEAMRVMLEVHHAGTGVAGTYTRDVAETLAAEATEAAQAQGYPLLVTTEPE
ncbi:MAG TPA: ATP-dependent Clp protease adaptor ClpS [Longimicrobiaceae bacterium]|nr:ATP-dependent Clp protease adaptor ClpS [Longimicrobiaceae bacterium]